MEAPMSAIPRLETLAYAVRSLWGSHVICGEFHVTYNGLVTGDIEVGQSHDNNPLPLQCTASCTGLRTSVVMGMLIKSPGQQSPLPAIAVLGEFLC